MKISSNKFFPCLFALAVAGFTSCNKLDEYNPSGATAEGVWTTPEGFVTAVNAAYSEQRSWYGKEDGIFMSEAGTDLWYNRDKNTYARQLTQYDGLSPNDGNPNKAAWKLLWQAINVANAGINRIDQAGFKTVEERNKREGELRFLRAFYYWHVVETYGGVMLRTTETQSPELTAQRSSVDEFYKLIISDLEVAANYLPADWGNEYSRASKKSAMGLLARAYLSRAYYATGSERQEWFTKARDAAKAVIDRQAELKVALWPNYADLWNPANNKKMGQPGGEALYVVSNSLTPQLNYDDNGNRLFHVFQAPYNNKPGLVQSLQYGFESNRRLMPTRALLDFYNEQIDSRYAGSFQEVWLANKADDPATAADERFTWTPANINTYKKDASLTNRVMRANTDTALWITKRSVADEDKRPYIVIDRDSMYNANGTIRNGQNFVNLKKFMDPDRTAANSQAGFKDVIVMRLAEMYLVAAEAELQLGNKTEAARYLNVLRTRAAIKAPVDQTAAMQVSEAQVDLDFILDERARELAGENIRWFDLKRTGKLLERVQKYNPDITQLKAHHILRPIPLVELQALKNAAEFGQNPGYN
ncbi:RagB/SusD family nutrient uptake outer membrane protein [Paraflavisolibacter sp. H34]|uniref:RagB/SusD family nutrient uptake outer membrane protein n=1 Tax=Huijunlia imazamoxiresistens TaxID=3127457 RepID=UPI0030189E2B